jgi:hypothetical protein
MTVTISQLYALYCQAYLDHDPVRGSLLPVGPGLPPVAHAVAELAETDAQDGRGLRGRAEFERSLAQGAGALVALGLRAA